MVGSEIRPCDHPKKDVRRVLEKWTARGWVLRKDGHWGRLYCPCEGRCTVIPVAGTPRSPTAHARVIDRLAARCPLPGEAPNRSLTGMPRGEA
ncbi:hypothetical protein ACH4GK_12400 [Streptomyces rimosus]|uniref:hypothetical protein n=1 Tax=Streptomyces TaxID=1883 RepID=UPI0004C8035A|nr:MULTISPECIES: hypothetical protein [Streptomyces]KOG65917.1 hypothetical protein ADK76_04405 [Streptomyces griseoflavus]KWT61372.1 hypothetical protein ADL21_13680 [Streptomyces albus subsp. albus]